MVTWPDVSHPCNSILSHRKSTLSGRSDGEATHQYQPAPKTETGARDSKRTITDC